VYSICGRAFTWLSPMRDQQIGGLLLWIPGSMMSVIGAVLALRHLMRLSARARLRDERIPAPASLPGATNPEGEMAARSGSIRARQS
jgi:putative membrane protein